MGYNQVGWTNFIAKKAYGNVWRLIPNSADRCITLTGSDVDTKITLNAKHRLIKLELFHMDASYAETLAYIFTASLFRLQGSVENTQFHNTHLWSYTSTIPYMIKKFGEGDEYEETTWTLRLLGTNTYKISVCLYVQVEIGDKNR